MLTAEQKKLVEDNQKLIFFALKRFHYPVDDFYDLAAIGLCKAAAKYDPEKGATFASYAIQAIRNELGYWKRTDSHYLRPRISIDAPIYDEDRTLADFLPSDDFDMENSEDAIFARECLKKAKVKEEQKAVFVEWTSGKTLKQIAKDHNRSIRWIMYITRHVRDACRDVALREGTGARAV